MTNKFKLTRTYLDGSEHITYPENFARAMKEIHDEIEVCDCHADDAYIRCEINGTLWGRLDGSEGYCVFILE